MAPSSGAQGTTQEITCRHWVNVIVTLLILMILSMSLLYLCYCSITHIVKQYGQHLKASTAMVRLRLYEVLALLPPQSFESEYKYNMIHFMTSFEGLLAAY